MSRNAPSATPEQIVDHLLSLQDEAIKFTAADRVQALPRKWINGARYPDLSDTQVEAMAADLSC